MFNKILIANRGEIACRVIRTARRMGIGTVAVYSDADRNALHVELADEAVAIGPAPASESYLSIPGILHACKESGAEAVHPGYGFLSENAAFARALHEAGITFIGPPPSAIEAMGDKIESKRFAAAAGVRTVPGHLGVVADADEAPRIAAEIGYPVMIKASAGGGGKGMRVAATEADAREGFERARSEARSSFGDDRVFIEKFIEEPRHIEIQILADNHGNVVHLGERECSIQRRNQKVVEEAPSSFLDAETRAEMGAQAVALARAVSYASAGTVEFIVDRNRNFFFLEMNTRLQVEHPVTELVTGLDLVEEMIRAAAGEPLRLTQADVAMSGWAVECRVYAEDPYRDFLPSVGRLTNYRPPSEARGGDRTIRIDSGVEEGSDISIFYDPMIAKLCTHGPSRAEAIEAMSDALDAFTIDGVRHNLPFLSALMAHPRWREGRLSTNFIPDEFAGGFAGAEPTAADRRALVAVAVSAELIEQARLAKLGNGIRSRRMGADWVLRLGAERIPISVAVCGGSGQFSAEISIDANAPARVDTSWRPGERLWRGSVDGAAVTAQVERRGHALHVQRRGVSRTARLLTPAVAELDRLMPEGRSVGGAAALLCPMPGVVVSIAVREGQKVEPGEAIATVEAMKMENVLRAERAATVRRILVKPGDSLSVDAPIVEFA